MSSYILILTEGENEEVFAINSLNESFFSESNMHIISYKTNIYSLYSQLKEDDFETDIIEILKEKNAGKDILYGEISINDIEREQVSEVYLIFDYDGHHYGPKNERVYEELKELFNYFDNETENGKLYLSYPMIESINYHNTYNTEEMIICHFEANSGKNHAGVHFKKIPLENIKKKLVSSGFTKEEWEEIFKQFIQVIHHFCGEAIYSYISPILLFKKQLALISTNNKIMILSAIPSFVFEYFGEKYFIEILARVNISAKSKYIDLSSGVPFGR